MRPCVGRKQLARLLDQTTPPFSRLMIPASALLGASLPNVYKLGKRGVSCPCAGNSAVKAGTHCRPGCDRGDKRRNNPGPRSTSDLICDAVWMNQVRGRLSLAAIH